MGETVEKTYFGILLGEAIITDLDFADDVVIYRETLEILVHAMGFGQSCSITISA